MIYQISYGQSYTGYSTAMTYVEADSYAHAMAKARANTCGNDRIQWIQEMPKQSTQQQ